MKELNIFVQNIMKYIQIIVKNVKLIYVCYAMKNT